MRLAVVSVSKNEWVLRPTRFNENFLNHPQHRLQRTKIKEQISCSYKTKYTNNEKGKINKVKITEELFVLMV